MTGCNGNGRGERKNARDIVLRGDRGTVAEFKTFVKNDVNGVSSVVIFGLVMRLNGSLVPLVSAALVDFHRAVTDGQLGDVLVGRTRGRSAESGPTEVSAELGRAAENDSGALLDLADNRLGSGGRGLTVVIVLTACKSAADNQSREKEERNQFLAHKDDTSKKCKM